MIHLFERAGLKLALDVGSGAVHSLDEAAWALLGRLSEDEIRTGTVASDLSDLRSRFGGEEIDGLLLELKDLAEQGLLYEDDSYAAFADQLGPGPVKALCLHVAHDCNLRCRYCFASTGGFGGARKLMDLDTAKAALDFLVRHSGSRRNLEVDFFGGEPLMNFEVVREAVKYGRSIESSHGKNFRFTLTTNGVELSDDKMDFIDSEMNNVVLSLDGRKSVNDHMRPYPDGSGSFDRILPQFQKLARRRGEQEKEYYVRGTFTRNNLDFDRDVLALADYGFDQISIEPVVVTEDKAYAIREEDIPEIEKSYERLLEEMIARRRTGEGNFNFFHFMVDLENGPCAIKRLMGCGCGNEYLAVTPDGELYPCHQFVGDEYHRMGSVHSDLVDTAMKDEFAQTNLLNKTACHDCWAKLYCSGGCNANNFSFNGSLYRPHEISCRLEKIRLECAIALKATEMQ